MQPYLKAQVAVREILFAKHGEEFVKGRVGAIVEDDRKKGGVVSDGAPEGRNRTTEDEAAVSYEADDHLVGFCQLGAEGGAEGPAH